MLFSDIENWLKGTDLKASRGTMELDEEVLGRYEAPTVTIQNAQAKKVADLLPVGAQIIGAEGRVDLVGTLDREVLVYLSQGGPRITVKAANRREAEGGRATPLFRGVEEAGWYWIERSRPARARRLTQELFLDLVSEVSDYDV